jgi:3-mercaptopyruvate sulfurtransferase SseA
VLLEWKDFLDKDKDYTIKSPDEIRAIMASINVKPEGDFTIYLLNEGYQIWL